MEGASGRIFEAALVSFAITVRVPRPDGSPAHAIKRCARRCEISDSSILHRAASSLDHRYVSPTSGRRGGRRAWARIIGGDGERKAGSSSGMLSVLHGRQQPTRFVIERQAYPG